MTPRLDRRRYEVTKAKLASLEVRLASIEAREDRHPTHKAEVIRSYHDMMRQLLRELKLYESEHPAEVE